MNFTHDKTIRNKVRGVRMGGDDQNDIPGKSNSSFVIDEALNEFLNYTENQYNRINLFDKRHPVAPLFDVYVSTPTNYTLDVEVENERVKSIYERRTPGIEVSNYQSRS